MSMDSRFQRILRLVKRTGDRVVVTDPDGEDAFVVMGLDQYEDLIDSFDYLNSDFEGRDDFEEEEGIDLGEEVEDEPIDDLPEDFFAPKPEKDTEPYIPDDFPAVSSADSLGKPKPDIWDVMQGAGESRPTWDIASASEEEQKYMAQIHEEVHGSVNELGSDVGVLAQQSQKDDNDLDEDQFYLEPVE